MDFFAVVAVFIQHHLLNYFIQKSLMWNAYFCMHGAYKLHDLVVSKNHQKLIGIHISSCRWAGMATISNQAHP